MDTTEIEDETEQDEAKDECDLEDRAEEFDLPKDPDEEHVGRERNHLNQPSAQCIRSNRDSGLETRDSGLGTRQSVRELTDADGDKDPAVEIGPILNDDRDRDPFRRDRDTRTVNGDPTDRERERRIDKIL